jgi:hypothetical protein
MKNVHYISKMLGGANVPYFVWEKLSEGDTDF